jgi:hypothetical protein
MRRVSNLAFNREFPTLTGMTVLPAENQVLIRRDRTNPYDQDAVGVWLEAHPSVPVGWLYRKDLNRKVVLQALDQGKTLWGRIQLRTPRVNGQKIVVFWL